MGEIAAKIYKWFIETKATDIDGNGHGIWVDLEQFCGMWLLNYEN